MKGEICKNWKFKCYDCGWEGRNPKIIVLPEILHEEHEEWVEAYCPKCGSVVELI